MVKVVAEIFPLEDADVFDSEVHLRRLQIAHAT